jgi:hypothetical protein
VAWSFSRIRGAATLELGDASFECGDPLKEFTLEIDERDVEDGVRDHSFAVIEANEITWVHNEASEHEDQTQDRTDLSSDFFHRGHGAVIPSRFATSVLIRVVQIARSALGTVRLWIGNDDVVNADSVRAR